MNPYLKSYQGFKTKQNAPGNKWQLLKIMAILSISSIFFILIKIKWLIVLIIKIIVWMTKFSYQTFFKPITLGTYRLSLLFNRRLKHTFAPSANRFFFLLTNRYVTHTIIIIITMVVVAENISIRQLRAEDIGRHSLYAEIFQGQYFTDEFITEEIIEVPTSKTIVNQERSPAVGSTVTIGGAETPETPTTLTQGGSALLKPDLTETMDTPKPRESTIIYIVEANDTIFDIAEKFNISIDTILWSNKLSSRSIIRPGDQLRIMPVTGVEHTVKRGENIGAIAAKYNVPQEDILVLNKLSATNTIQSGQILVIPDGRPLYTPPPPTRYAKAEPTPNTSTYSSTGGELFWPTTCRRITQYFKGWLHTGVDIACSIGSNVYAAEEGVVDQAGWNSGGYGNRVIIRHSDGTKTLYAHLKAKGILVAPGDYVAKGEVIGLMGSTGRSTGSHLHFEVLIGGSRVNPFSRL